MTKYVCAPHKCMGCGMCQNICPKACITLEYDSEGFLNPVKDLMRCTQCDLCSDYCIAEGISLIPSADSILYCAKSLSTENLSNCTSGGIFGELANTVITKYNGVVYGAVYDNGYHVKHVRGETIQDTQPMHYSKYVQSDTSGIYLSVMKDLKDGRTVLFTGTPCQIVALRCFIGKEYKNLLCMDVLCYGVMSTYVLRDYIQYVLPSEKELEHLEICFRSKKIPKSNSSFVISRGGEVLYHEPFHSAKSGIGRAFGALFVNRVSCTDCAFRELGRYSDLTVGDYVSENTPNTFSHSLVMVNTEKGQTFFLQLLLKKQLLTDDERNFSLRRVKRKTPENKQRTRFFKMYLVQGINNKTVALWKRKYPSLWQILYAKYCKMTRRCIY